MAGARVSAFKGLIILPIGGLIVSDRLQPDTLSNKENPFEERSSTSHYFTLLIALI